jgi:hypothetical protein
MASTLGGAVEFLKDLGLFDVVLPFLLVFSIIFAILEKTEILGKGQKNINSIVALSVALITIAANQVVTAITTAIPNIVLLIVISLGFLIQLGLFMKKDDGGLDFATKHAKWYKTFVWFLFIGVILVFANSVETDDGETWLEFIWNYLAEQAGEGVFAGVIFLAIVVGVVWLAQRSSGGSE